MSTLSLGPAHFLLPYQASSNFAALETARQSARRDGAGAVSGFYSAQNYGNPFRQPAVVSQTPAAGTKTEPDNPVIQSQKSVDKLVESFVDSLRGEQRDLEARTGVRLSLSMFTKQVQREQASQPAGEGERPVPDQTRRTVTTRHAVSESRTSTVNRTERKNVERHFFRRTETLAWKLEEQHANALRETRDTLKLRFRVDIRMNFKLLERFADQSEALAARNDDTLPAYLTGTDAAVRRSPDVLTELFDRVDTVLDAAEERFIEKIEDFLHQVHAGGDFAGLPLGEIKDHVISAIRNSFDSARQALGEFRDFHAEQIRTQQPGAELDVAA